jgi:8-amino-7-oxononanoate synthase
MRSDPAYRAYLEAKKEAGHLRALVAARHPDARTIIVEQQRHINFSSNDYLALSHDARLIERACAFARDYGVGSGASRLVTGNLDLFEAIEAKVARLKGTEAALVFASGFQANAAVLQALLDRQGLKAEPLVLADKLNHASMHFGCAAAGARQLRYRHLDVAHLAELLEKHADDERPKFILSESVFSMDGDIADMARLALLARTHEAMLVCDDAHATGILGAHGGGLSHGADVIVGTFSKAMGSFGAYVACSRDMRDYLINRAGGFIYSTAPPPALLGAIDAALDLVGTLDQERAHVAGLAAHLRAALAARGIDSGGSATQIVPVMLGSAARALAVSEALRRQGSWVTAIRPPTVPQGTARLRVTFTAAHTPEDVERLVAAIEGVAKF